MVITKNMVDVNQNKQCQFSYLKHVCNARHCNVRVRYYFHSQFCIENYCEKTYAFKNENPFFSVIHHNQPYNKRYYFDKKGMNNRSNCCGLSAHNSKRYWVTHIICEVAYVNNMHVHITPDSV